MKFRATLLHHLTIIIICTLCFPALAVEPTRKEQSTCEKWTKEHLRSEKSQLPFTFNYGGKSSSELLPSWKFNSTKREIGQYKTERILSWKDPESQLSVRCVVVEYRDYPAVEWTLY